ncbi:DUF3024 domain-containing protein [Psychromonas sp. PT13]|uniref:DUF3024 domain-containing protein n=1 Tax=Psychromonas sp. PT13 TaxID=3439547 RepID=UPI003EBAADA6
MPLSEFEIKRYEIAKKKFLLKRRPHPSVRDKCDLDCRLSNQTVEVFEQRPQWNNTDVFNEYPLAKMTYVKTKKEWEIFYMSSNLTWKSYRLHKSAKTIEEVFVIIDCDETGIFFG